MEKVCILCVKKFFGTFYRQRIVAFSLELEEKLNFVLFVYRYIFILISIDLHIFDTTSIDCFVLCTCLRSHNFVEKICSRACKQCFPFKLPAGRQSRLH